MLHKFNFNYRKKFGEKFGDKKYNEKLFKETDDSFLIGFYEGFKSETGIPTKVINPINKPIIK